MILNVETIQEKAPYKVTKIADDKHVAFFTDYGVQYIAGFDKDDITMPVTETYQFSIINFNNKKSPRDPKVRETIIAIVENFFVENQEVMLYICETGDGRQSMRNRLFEYWIDNYKKKWKIMFLTASIPDENGILNYASIIIRQDHPRLKEVIREFSDTVTLLNDKPQQ